MCIRDRSKTIIYPAEFVVEMIEQVRLWFYSMLVFGVIFEGKAPYRNVLGFAEVRDENNKKVSKTKGNYIPCLLYTSRCV